MTVGAVAVVGAGHAGLCVVASLRRRGVVPVVYDSADRLGDTWRSRYDGLRLNTERDLSLVTDATVDQSVGRWPTRDEWAGHIESAAGQLGVGDDAERVTDHVTSIRPNTGEAPGWAVATDRGGRRTHAVVVVATGRNRVASIPEWPGLAASGIEVIHSSRFRSPEPFAGRRVLVVGSGNSGTEIAHLLADAGIDTMLSMRSRPVWSRRDLFGTTLTRLAVRARGRPDWLIDVSGRVVQAVLFRGLRRAGLAPPDHRLSHVAHASGATLDSGFVGDVRAGRIRVVTAVEFFDGDRVALVDGVQLDVDAVIAATGSHPGLEEILPDELLHDGWPAAGEAPFEQAPGLFTAGLNPARLTAFHPDFRTEADQIAAAIVDRLDGR